MWQEKLIILANNINNNNTNKYNNYVAIISMDTIGTMHDHNSLDKITNLSPKDILTV